MENGDKTITPADVIAKLKDDGDFDKLRLQIIQKLKDNEELRNSIASVVKQSSVLNRAGAENMKPRQLSDAIREDVGDRLMSQLSEGVWKIIRDEDEMKKEIRGTIESVYYRMLNPDYKEDELCVTLPPQNEDVTSTLPVSVHRVDETVLDNNFSEPPGFSLSAVNNLEESQKERTQMESPQGKIVQKNLKNEKHYDSRGDIHHNQVLPLVSQGTESTRSGDCSDEDPDLPPGFG